MARKKREIQKRKKQVDSGTDYIQEPERNEAEPDPSESGDDLRIKTSDTDRTRPQGASKAVWNKVVEIETGKETRDTWFSQNMENLLLILLVLYVLLLGLGTAGELFEIEWILNLPLFK